MVSDFRQAESCIPTSASSRVASFVSGGCASEPLRGMVSDFRQAESCIPTSASSRVAPYVSGGCASEPLRGMVSDFRQAESCIPTSASSRVAPCISGGCANFPLRGVFRFPASRTTCKTRRVAGCFLILERISKLERPPCRGAEQVCEAWKRCDRPRPRNGGPGLGHSIFQ